MDKLTFIAQIKPALKERGFRKNGNYWYKPVDEHLCCIFVQGSQWDKNNYYVELGFAMPTAERKNPTLLYWLCRHRCNGCSGEVNILPHELLACVDEIFTAVTTTDQIPDFLESRDAQRVATQLWF